MVRNSVSRLEPSLCRTGKAPAQPCPVASTSVNSRTADLIRPGETSSRPASAPSASWAL